MIQTSQIQIWMIAMEGHCLQWLAVVIVVVAVRPQGVDMKKKKMKEAENY